MAKGSVKKGPETNETIDILEVSKGRVEFCVLGTTPFICNRMSQKGLRDILFPPKRKTQAERQSTLKHNPMQEFRASPYTATGDDAPTRLLIPSAAFHGALSSVATDMPGVVRTQIARLTWVNGQYVDLYGVPTLSMMVVRSADMAKTPDVRTRALVQHWACRVSINYTRPLVKEKDVVNLLAAAGFMRGVGDYRPEKGKGNFGQFELVSFDDKRFIEVVKTGGREAQDAALANPACYDAETAELLSWFHDEVGRRGFTRLDESAQTVAPNGGSQA